MRLGNAAVRVLAGLSIGVLAVGCSSSSTTSQSSSASSPSAAGDNSNASGGTPIKIGIEFPLSGGDASNGIPSDNGAKLAIQEANKAGVPGGFTFVADDLDDAVQGTHDPAQGAQNTKTFISDSAVLAMIGPFNSNVAKAEIPLTNDAGLAQISPAATNPGLTKGPDAKKGLTHPDVIAFFRVCTTDDKQGAAGATFAKELRENPDWVNRLLLVGVVDDRLAGFGRVVFFQSSPNAPENVAPTGWYLGGVIVTPAHRRRGIGYELTRQRLEWIRARAEEVFYVVNALNRASAALHERFGFEELTRDFFIPGASFIGGVGILYRARLCETP